METPKSIADVLHRETFKRVCRNREATFVEGQSANDSEGCLGTAVAFPDSNPIDWPGFSLSMPTDRLVLEAQSVAP